jgi:hypothetical protein
MKAHQIKKEEDLLKGCLEVLELLLSRKAHQIKKEEDLLKGCLA